MGGGGEVAGSSVVFEADGWQVTHQQRLSWKLLSVTPCGECCVLPTFAPGAPCFRVYKIFLFWDYYFLIGVITDIGPLVISSPDGPREFPVTCLGSESLSGDQGFQLMGTLLGFIQ